MDHQTRYSSSQSAVGNLPTWAIISLAVLLVTAHSWAQSASEPARPVFDSGAEPAQDADVPEEPTPEELAAQAREQAAGELLNAANDAYQAGDAESAIVSWREIESDYPGTASWPKAIFNLGIALKEAEDYQAAIEQFEKMFAEDAIVNDLEPGAHLMEAYRSYRHRTMWQIGDCYMALEDYEAALAAYRLTDTTYPLQSWCGTCAMSSRLQFREQEALCLSYLQRWDEVAAAYAAMGSAQASMELVSMYETTGQLDDLTAMLDSWDAQWAAEWEAGGGEITEQIFTDYRQSRPVRQLLDLHALQRDGDLEGLLAVLLSEDRDIRIWEKTEAMSLLARTPEGSAAMLIAYLETPEPKNTAPEARAYLTLGMCGTAEAVALLRGRAATGTASWDVRVAVKALSSSPAGEQALEELANSSPSEYLTAALAEAEDGMPDFAGDLRRNSVVWLVDDLPEVPADVALPTDLFADEPEEDE